MSSGHVVLDEEGEYFDEDPTVGRGVPSDPAGELPWKPMQPVPASAAFLEMIQQSIPPPTPAGSPTTTT